MCKRPQLLSGLLALLLGGCAREPEIEWDDPHTAEARQAVEQLRAEIHESRTKNALTLRVGTAPECQPGDPGTEICRWTWIWRPRALSERVALEMTCVLPWDGSPRGDDSCRFGPVRRTPE